MTDNSVYIKVLIEALRILAHPDNWTKEGIFDDPCSDTRERYSLDCALKIAQRKVKGEYHARSREMTAIRKVILFHFFWRYGIHPIYNFNKHRKTTHQDVIGVLQRAIIKLND